MYIMFIVYINMHIFKSLSEYTHAAAAAYSLQSCPTLCDPVDSRPPGSSVDTWIYTHVIVI